MACLQKQCPHITCSLNAELLGTGLKALHMSPIMGHKDEAGLRIKPTSLLLGGRSINLAVTLHPTHKTAQLKTKYLEYHTTEINYLSHNYQIY